MPKNIFHSKIAAAALAVLMIILVVTIFSGRKAVYDTCIAEFTTVSDVKTYDGYVIVDDVPIPGAPMGTVVPVIDDGTKIEQNGVVAHVYAGSVNAGDYEEIKKLETEKNYYDNLKTGAGDYMSNISVSNANILKSVTGYAAAVESGRCADAEVNSGKLREYLTVKQIITGQTVDVERKRAELESRIRTLSGTAGTASYGSVRIGENTNGYYYSSSDGYEELTKKLEHGYTDIKGITCSEIHGLDNVTPGLPSAYGKIVKNTKWYFVCVMPKKHVQDGSLELSHYYDISFMGSAANVISMRLEAMNEDADTGEIAVVFSSMELSADIISLRKVTAEVCFSSFEGISIPKTAIRTVKIAVSENVTDENGVVQTDADGYYKKHEVEHEYTGVFIRLNNVARFRKINILCSDGDRFIAELVADNSQSEYIKINDEIFTQGVGLHDKQIVRGGYF